VLERGSVEGVPRAVRLMMDKFAASLRPHKRKRIEVACVVHATTVEVAAEELEELAFRLRESGLGYMGHGSGYRVSIAYSSCKRDMDRLARMTRWIRVREDMPEDGVSVLVVVVNVSDPVSMGYHDGDGWHLWEWPNHICTVSHWMNLPEVPV
jgi:hypothetical protein